MSFCPGELRTLQLKTATHEGEPSPSKLVAGEVVDVTVRLARVRVRVRWLGLGLGLEVVDVTVRAVEALDNLHSPRPYSPRPYSLWRHSPRPTPWSYLLWQVRAVDAFDNLVDNVRRPQEEPRF